MWVQFHPWSNISFWYPSLVENQFDEIIKEELIDRTENGFNEEAFPSYRNNDEITYDHNSVKEEICNETEDLLYEEQSSEYINHSDTNIDQLNYNFDNESFIGASELLRKREAQKERQAFYLHECSECSSRLAWFWVVSFI